ncbi:MAG: adenosylmethionine--8-amino-7-oxononanoate transaminase [Planctomycetota bacterium]|nr:MAG: adenosylmethionine--8-amino-7-oxononanoate transaminase [Planctomycetota bacterium]
MLPPRLSNAILRHGDNAHVWHPFTPMPAYEDEQAPIIESGKGFELIDTQGRHYLDGTSSLWCNVHGHRVFAIDQAIRDQLDRIGHSTLLGLSSVPSIELACRLVRIVPRGLTRVFYSDSGATAVEAALKIAVQFHRQRRSGASERTLFAAVADGYHGDTVGSVSVGRVPRFHAMYDRLLFPTRMVPNPGQPSVGWAGTRDAWEAHCLTELERVIAAERDQLAAFILEPLVQGAAGILVHSPHYLRQAREITSRHGVLLIADEVAVGFGRTGTMFACEQAGIVPDLLCLAKGLTGGYLPLAATLCTDEIEEAFRGAPQEGRTFYHGHTYTGNPLGCAAAVASLDMFQNNRVLDQVAANTRVLEEELAPLANHPHVAEVRQQGVLVGIELVQDRDARSPFPAARRTGHRVTLAARRLGAIIRPIGDVVTLVPAPAMPSELVRQLCHVAREAIDEAVA